jgi:hypothetical protein
VPVIGVQGTRCTRFDVGPDPGSGYCIKLYRLQYIKKSLHYEIYYVESYM